VSVSYQLEVKNKGGHSSMPTKDNAIYRLSEGLARLSKFSFPFKLNETTRAYFERPTDLEGDQVAADIRSVTSARTIQARSRLSGCPQTRSTTRNCAQLASPPCWRADTRTMRCRRLRALPSTAASCRANR